MDHEAEPAVALIRLGWAPMAAISDLDALLAGLAPRLRPGRYVFLTLPEDEPVKAKWRPIMTFLEDEGRTVVLDAKVAKAAELQGSAKLAWITLDVHSDLEAVGLTAAVSGALAEAGISCNVVAAAYHDHLFVPADAAERALAVLQELAPRPVHASRHAASAGGA